LRLLAFAVTAFAGLMAAQATTGLGTAAQVFAVMLTMAVFQAILLPVLGDRSGFFLAEMATDLLLGAALGAILYLGGLASARYLTPLRNVWVLGLVWPIVVYWPKRGKGP
jgi:hypothetical protein